MRPCGRHQIQSGISHTPIECHGTYDVCIVYTVDNLSHILDLCCTTVVIQSCAPDFAMIVNAISVIVVNDLQVFKNSSKCLLISAHSVWLQWFHRSNGSNGNSKTIGGGSPNGLSN